MSVTINDVSVPVVPDMPKSVPSEQLFVYVEKNEARSGAWYFGNTISGEIENQVVSTSGIANAIVGDSYMNISESTSRGNIYTCVLAGTANIAKWTYVGNVTSVKSQYNNTLSAVLYTLQNYCQYTFVDNLTSMTIIVPSQSYQGFISEVDFVTDSTGCSFSIINNSGKDLKMLYKGWPIDSYTPSAGTEVRMLFSDNGNSILCVIVEI